MCCGLKIVNSTTLQKVSQAAAGYNMAKDKIIAPKMVVELVLKSGHLKVFVGSVVAVSVVVY
jgi:hypothetical protein